MDEFHKIIEDIINNDEVKKMKTLRQHCNVSCFTHCLNVSHTCYLVAKKLGLDYVSIARAGMLHDFFLYDWHGKKVNRKGFHAFTHGKCAMENASKIFDLNEKEKDMIKKHMWPVTPIPPKSIEGLILTFVDKYCAVKETIQYLRNKRFHLLVFF